MKVHLSVVQILECEKIEKADKLLKLIVDDGEGRRQLVAGIAKWYTPQELIGKKVLCVKNLAPAKLRGIASNGMILAATLPNGDAQVVLVDDAVPCGARVR